MRGSGHTVVAFCGATIRLLSDAGETTLGALGYLLSAQDFELIGAGRVPKVDRVGPAGVAARGGGRRRAGVGAPPGRGRYRGGARCHRRTLGRARSTIRTPKP